MTPERTQAYGRVMHTLAALGPAKLLTSEEEVLRTAADELILAPEDSATALQALHEAQELLVFLVEVERWTGLTSSVLADDLEACGPFTPVSHV